MNSIIQSNIFFYRNNTDGIIGCVLADHAGLCLGGIFFKPYLIFNVDIK